MTEYIERGAALMALCVGCHLHEEGEPCGCAEREELLAIPTADVVPRSEVAREIFEDIERVAMSKIDENAPISPLDDIYYIQAIDEVREKYTEGEK